MEENVYDFSTKTELINKLIDYSKSPDDDNIRYKEKIKKILLSTPELLYALHDKDLEHELFNDDGTLKGQIVLVSQKRGWDSEGNALEAPNIDFQFHTSDDRTPPVFSIEQKAQPIHMTKDGLRVYKDQSMTKYKDINLYDLKKNY